MPRNTPVQQPEILTVKVKRHWWEIVWIDGIITIITAVSAAVIVHWIYREPSSIQPPSIQQASPTKSPVAIDIIPTHQNLAPASSAKETAIYAGKEVSVVCKPAWAPAVNYGSYRQINLWVENVVFNENSSDIGVAVSPWTGSGADAALKTAEGTYITDDNGFRYDLQKDGGSYSNSERTVKADEIYRFRLVFGRIGRTEKIVLHHPQFQSITLYFPWARVSSSVTKESRPSSSPSIPAPSPATEKADDRVSSDVITSPAPTAKVITPSNEHFAGTVSKVCAGKQELAIFKNGFVVRYDRRESVGSMTRLYTGSGYMDVATDQISSIECPEPISPAPPRPYPPR